MGEEEVMAWWFRMVLRRVPSVLQGPAEVIEVPSGEVAELHLAEPWSDGLGYLRLVGADGGWGEVESFAFFEPTVEELADRRSDAVGPSCWIHKVTTCSVSRR
jgi:hypothetical protein